MSELKRPGMVRWFSPQLLLRTGIEVLISSIFSRHADQRSFQAIARKAEYQDYSSGQRVSRSLEVPFAWIATAPIASSDAPDSITIDYVADLGDGFNSTYAVAWALFQRPLGISSPRAGGSCRAESLCPGDILVFGGDQVYPAANRFEYERRLLEPYEMALRGAGRQGSTPDIYAIPGNHDWYDSLTSFSRIFLADAGFPRSDERSPVQCCTPQQRSYFALRLRHGWWLLGTDVQLGSDIDGSQLRYFEEVNKQIPEGDRVILCTAEPFWLNPKAEQRRERGTAPTALDLLARSTLVDDVGQSRVWVMIAGDIHHYMRYKEEGSEHPRHKITAGGGGAFLHPTHTPWKHRLTERPIEGGSPPKTFIRAASFPPPNISARLAWLNWFFLLKNPSFGVVTGILYTVIALVFLQAYSVWDQRGDVALASESSSIYAPSRLDLDSRSPRIFSPGDADFAYEDPRHREDPSPVLMFRQQREAPLLSRPKPNERVLSLITSMTAMELESPTVIERRLKPTAWITLTGVLVEIFTLSNPLDSLFALVVFSVVLGGFILFSDLPKLAWRIALGAVHGLIHITLAFLSVVLTVYWMRSLATPPMWAANPAMIAISFCIGWIVGSIVVGAYLWLSLLFGNHWNAAFSSIRVQNWKCFLRLQITQDGLTIYPIGIPRLPEWRAVESESRSQDDAKWFEPVDSKWLPCLIEEPIRIPRK